MLPIIKYSGGKRREIKFFEKYFPKKFDRYIEPFFGGGAVYFYLEPEKAIINDLNSNLINFYRTFSTNRDELVEQLSGLENNEDTYYKIRDMFNNKVPKEYLDAVIYYYINKTCFSGMIRYNSKGEFNVPFGRYKKVDFIKPLTKEASSLLSKAIITNTDFEEVFNQAKEEDFIFLDPPYMSTFQNYNPDGFSEDDQRRLFECFKNTKAKCLLIISDLGIIRELYKNYIKEEYQKTYAINIKDRMKENNNVTHLIITNYDIQK